MPNNTAAIVLFHQEQTVAMAGTPIAPTIVTEMILLHNQAPQVYVLHGREKYEEFCRTHLLPAYGFNDGLETKVDSN